MPRWEPDARNRLARAAFALYAERGFEDTTVAEIAERAGLTERTFFRHFADKREVLFPAAKPVQAALVTAVADAPESLAPIDAVAEGLVAAAALIQERETAAARLQGLRPRKFAQQRHAIIAASAELRGRELDKAASLASALGETLRRRGLEEPVASVLAEIAVAVFKVAYERRIDKSNDRDFPQLVRESVEQLKALAAAGTPPAHVTERSRLAATPP